MSTATERKATAKSADDTTKTAGMRTYRAHRAMGGVDVGGEFQATADDPRVLSGYVSDVGPVGGPEAPDQVREALDGEGAVSDPA